MKIAVSGKGGSGKTIISGTLARTFAQRGHDVLAIDDDHDPNLATSLGVSRDADISTPPDDAVERVETDDDEGPSWDLTASRQAIIDDYGFDAPDGVTLLRAGVVDDAGDSSFGYSHITAYSLYANAGTDEETEVPEDVTIVDMPAGLGVTAFIDPADVLLMVVEPSYNSLETIRKLNGFANEHEVPDVRVIANDVRTEQDLEFIEEHCLDLGLEVSMVIPQDDSVRHAEQNGLAPVDYDDESPAVSAIRDLADDLEVSNSATPSNRT